MKTFKLTILAFLMPLMLFAQFDTIRVMQYNILFYGANGGGCSNSNNGLTMKDANFKRIAKATNPDILCINEMGNSPILADRILQNVLNTDSVNYYRKGVYTNGTNSTLTNMMFYNSEKLVLHSEEVINAPVRDINLSRLYYKDSLGTANGDTVFITVINGHLKAGSSTSDRDTRDLMTQEVMSVLNAKGVRDNYLALGDFNARSSNEDAIQNLLNPSNPDIKFVDPINSLGSWNNNSNFANVHTQSTHTSGGCPAGGGMDDRFDMILASEYIIGDSAGARYIPGSYTAFGQDGNRFNGTINQGTNQAVPDSIADALFDLSDHIPVYLDLEVKQYVDTTSGVYLESKIRENIQIVNPSVENLLKIYVKRKGDYRIQLYNLQSQLILDAHIGKNEFETIPFVSENGVYLLKIEDVNGYSQVYRILKN